MPKYLVRHRLATGIPDEYVTAKDIVAASAQVRHKSKGYWIGLIADV